MFFDEEEKLLVIEIKNNNMISFQKLLNRYSNLLFSLSYEYKNKFYYLPLEVDDLYNYLVFSLFELTKKYDQDSLKSFPLYLKEFLSYYLSNYLKKFQTKNNSFTNNLVLTEEEYYNYDLNLKHDYHVEEIIEIIKKIKSLSNFEKEVVIFMIEGYSPFEISKLLNKKITSIYATNVRAKKKIINFIKK